MKISDLQLNNIVALKNFFVQYYYIFSIIEIPQLL